MAKTVNELYKEYLGKGFDEKQLQEIKLGLIDGVDVTRYARQDMPAGEMAYQRKLLNYDAIQAKPEPKPIYEEIDTYVSKNKQAELMVVKLSNIAITIGEISILIAGTIIILHKLLVI